MPDKEATARIKINKLLEEKVGEDYIVRTQRPNYQSEVWWRSAPDTSRKFLIPSTSMRLKSRLV
jgi:hypothetical protein